MCVCVGAPSGVAVLWAREAGLRVRVREADDLFLFALSCHDPRYATVFSWATKLRPRPSSFDAINRMTVHLFSTESRN